VKLEVKERMTLSMRSFVSIEQVNHWQHGVAQSFHDRSHAAHPTATPFSQQKVSPDENIVSRQTFLALHSLRSTEAAVKTVWRQTTFSFPFSRQPLVVFGARDCNSLKIDSWESRQTPVFS
jgi:hypothetical protein